MNHFFRIALLVPLVGMLAGSATMAGDKKGNGQSEVAGKYKGVSTYADPSVGLGPLAMPTTILVKASGNKLTLMISSAFPATFGTPTVYPFAIYLALKKHKLSGKISGVAVTFGTGAGSAKLKRGKITGTVTTSPVGPLSAPWTVNFRIPFKVEFKKQKLRISAAPSDDFGFSWGTASFSGKKKK